MGTPYIMRKGVSRLGDLVDGYSGLVPLGAVQVLYVNGVTWANGFPAGSDGNDGTIDAPIHTLTEALSRCTDEGNDVIIVLDYWAATGETWPIAVNKSLVSIIGVGIKPSWNWVQLYSAAAVCMDITGRHVLIRGLGFTPVSTSPAITFDDGAENVWIDQCGFHVGLQGILVATADINWGLKITGCHFHTPLSVGGILISDDVVDVVIANNRFDRLAGDCIHITSAIEGEITGNRFSLKSNGEGLAITLATSVARFHVDDNHATYGEVTTTSPYEDEGTSTTNGWGLNYLNLTAITPV